jgi:hypothetical protein
MRPLKLTIAGSFWDSQIYSGRLYLFTDSGAIRTLDWDRIVSEWPVDQRLRLAMECAFRRSDYLYESDFFLLLHDPEIKRLIFSKFDDLSSISLTIDAGDDAGLVGEQDTPFPFPHSDSVIYLSQMYVGTSVGLFRGTCDKRTVKPLSTKPEKKWDGPSISIAASYGEIAVAAGDYGLFEIPVQRISGRSPRATLEKSCNKCSWNFQSIYCTGSAQNGWLADFEKIKREDDGFTSRRFTKELSSEDIFGEQGFTWSRQDKMYLAAGGSLRIARYIPWQGRDKRLVRYNEPVQLPSEEEVLAGAVANFGTILEYKDSISVLQSDNDIFTVTGDPVAWRIFPKSKHYENQLHVIFENRLEIYSFNHDYFLDQENKRLGTTNFRFGNSGYRHSWRNIAESDVDDLLDEDPEADDIDWGSALA